MDKKFTKKEVQAAISACGEHGALRLSLIREQNDDDSGDFGEVFNSPESWAEVFAEVSAQYPHKKFQFIPYTYANMSHNGKILESMLAIPM